MDDVLADINVDDPTAQVGSDTEMPDAAPRAIQKQEKQKKDKMEKKDKKELNTEGQTEGGEKKKKKRKDREVEGQAEVRKEKRMKV